MVGRERAEVGKDGRDDMVHGDDAGRCVENEVRWA